MTSDDDNDNILPKLRLIRASDRSMPSATQRRGGPSGLNATVHDVARMAGVSAMTVSRVVNGSASVRPETRRRVERAVIELDFVPNGVARGLMSSRSGTLGVIVPDIVNPFFSIVVRGAETVARRA